MSWSRAFKVVETERRLVSSVPIWASRAARLPESADTPESACRKFFGVLRVRSDRVVRLLASRWVLMRSEVLARPENACTTSYGDWVREVGISLPCGSWPGP